ncbi:hypothetical protein B566_EDAN012490 [Ephemera danica]|nr:hypothetical protein B566_EDAN012490 [Ephemera danica]
MKVKVLVRNPDEYMRETKQDIHKMQRNYAPDLHPLEAPREYTRALNAVKLERVFAKPFLGCMEAHRDGVSCIAKHPDRLSLVASGAFDGEVIMWSVAARKAVFRIPAHDGVARGLAFTPDGQHLISVGDDQTIKTWQVLGEDLVQPDDIEPVATLICKVSSSLGFRLH